jgi:hypothetical protein
MPVAARSQQQGTKHQAVRRSITEGEWLLLNLIICRVIVSLNESDTGIFRAARYEDELGRDGQPGNHPNVDHRAGTRPGDMGDAPR